MALVVMAATLGGCSTIIARSTPAPVIAMDEAVSAGDLAKCKELAALAPELIHAPEQARRQTPLFLASVAGHQDVVVWLLEQGADVDAKDRFGSTPLFGAAYEGRTQVAATLLDKGADVNASDDDGYAPLDLAAYRQHLETAKLLVVARGATIDGGPSRMDPVFQFARYGNKEGVEWALSLGAHIAGKNLLNGWTAMHWLAKGASESKEEALTVNLYHGERLAEERSASVVQDAKYLEVFRVLMANGAAVDTRGDRKDAPLHLAVEADNLAIATALLDAGAEVDPRDIYEQTPLDLAANSGRTDMVRLLVARGADTNARDHVGFTPLITATRWGGGEAAIRDVVEALIAGGADVNAKKPGGGWGPAGNDGLTALQQAAEFGYASVVELLLRSGADVNKEFADGRTPLYWAAKNGHRDVVASLLAHGANVNAEAKSRTALGAARDGGHGEITDMLLKHGARE